MDAQPGERFGRYELVAQLGRGGMAEAWRARLVGAAGVTKPVLIKKVLPEYSGDEAFTAMFISEARITATLSHGNIAQVFDFGEVDGEYFLAMEFVDGQPLNRVLKRAMKSGLPALPVALATYTAMEMCRGLHYAHTRTDEAGEPLGIVHRDISPDNVLISYEGQVKIVDFGIAKARALRNFKTEAGVVKGKYLFFSPEQARGEEVDARTDVWACAVVLYEMLCGRLPLEGPPYVVLRKLVAGDFPRPRELRPELPAELDDIIMQALAVEREARIGSCHEFGNALAGFLYATAPRFSSMSLSYLLKELFRQDLTVDGREARVPPSFLEELTAWRDAARGSKVSAVSQRLRPPRESLSEDDPPPAMSPEQAARFRNGMLALAGGVAALGIAVAAISSIPKAPPPAPVQELPWAVPPATSKAEPVPAAPAERAPAAPASAEAPPRRRPPARGSAKYPVDSIRLEAARDVVKPADTSATSQELDPRLTYQLYEEAPPCDGPPIFYLLSGEAPLTAEDSVGTLSERPITLQWVRKVTLFTVGEPPPSPGPRHVRLDELRPTGEPVQLESIKVNPLMSAASLARAFVLEGLSGSRTYELRLVAGEEGALVRGARGGRVRKVVCARQTGAAAAGPVDTARYGQLAKEQQFLLQPGRPARLEAARGVSCGFVDDDPSDNEGGLELHISEVSRH